MVGDYCQIHKQLFCLCRASEHGLVEARPFRVGGEEFYFSRRDSYALVLDKHLAPVTVLSDLPVHLSEAQAIWLTRIYRGGYLDSRNAAAISGPRNGEQTGGGPDDGSTASA